MNTRIERLKVCLNGGRSREDHPAVPRAPAELAVSAAGAVDAGAEAVHLHPRGADGGESLLAADVAAAVTAVRQACPGTPVGVFTGVWITGGDPTAVRRRTGVLAADRPRGTLGLPTRIGLEDTIVGPDGSPVSGNAELVRLALQIWRASAAP